MTKINEIIIEPSKIYVDSNFKIKIKAVRYTTYNDVKNKTYNYSKKFKYKDLRGD